ncbi:flagellar motor switch protein FliN [Lignipirellula cremea]|uniref:Flagellar motor switch protein FliN n=1 Tax=Lignipirellula cremea TaxID=2528010 RepID=A0A518E0I0_9BACT|nr:flagellar motor switch protein FliN [Lignipirellula cremea]QDU97596.1 Flagellar motor switch protein FliN [Lignipirellula cremea]
MAEDPDKIGQDEIEALLRSSQDGPEASAKPASGATTAAASPPSGAKPATDSSDVTEQDLEFLFNQAQAAIASVDKPVETQGVNVSPFEFRDFGGAPASHDRATLDLLRDVELGLRIELGRTQMYIEDVLKLRKGSVVALDKLAGDPVDIFANGRLIARGEVLVLNDNFCVRVAELVTGDDDE